MDIQLKVSGIAFSDCVNTVTKAIKRVDADTKAKIVNVQSRQSENKILEL